MKGANSSDRYIHVEEVFGDAPGYVYEICLVLILRFG